MSWMNEHKRVWILSATTGGLVNMVAGLVTGTTVFTDRVREFSLSLLVLLLVLPFFSTLFLILRGDHRCQLVFHVAAWSLAIGLGLWLGKLRRIQRKVGVLCET